MQQGYAGNPYTTYGSCDLKDNPNALYQKMAGATNKDTDYRFKVVPVDAGTGTSPSLSDCSELRVTLDNRSVADPEAEDARHTDYEFGEWNGHVAGAELDSGVLTLATTDLAIASWGPSAALSRTYRSAVSATGQFAPGWFFAFEQNLAIGASEVAYTDAERRTHTFRGSGSVWNAPNGFLATLEVSGSNWRLSFFDSSYLTFDSAGKLVSETDANGNATTYTWSGGELTRISAANGQYIDLTYTSGALSAASYTTAAGTRSVTYTTASPWRVTLFSGSAVARTLEYAYGADLRLTNVEQLDWPTSGAACWWGFGYGRRGGPLVSVTYPDYDATTKPDARASVTYGTEQATIEHYGTVEGTADQVMNQEVLTWSAAWDGVPNQLVSRTTGSGDLASTETYNYAFDRQLALTSASDGGLVSETINLCHDLTSTTTTTGSLDAPNQIIAFGYDTQAPRDARRRATRPRPPTRSPPTPTPNANLTATETSDQGGTLLSASSYTYDAQGRTTQEKRLISGTVQSGTWTQTDYSDFAACGEPQTTIARGIKLSPSANPAGPNQGDLLRRLREPPHPEGLEQQPHDHHQHLRHHRQLPYIDRCRECRHPHRLRHMGNATANGYGQRHLTESRLVDDGLRRHGPVPASPPSSRIERQSVHQSS